MPDPDFELEARLRAATEAAIAKVVAERKLPAEATLADIERVALDAGQQIEQAIVMALAQESAAQLSAWPACPQCGQKMKNKGKRQRRIVTEAGEVEVERAYYYCATCHQGFFPLDERWELTHSVYSPELAKQMVWLASSRAYPEAVETFARIGRRSVPAGVIWEETQRHGERLRRYLAHQQAQVSVERVVLPPAGADHDRPLGVSLDGGKMHIRGEGWKEFKAGAVFDVVATPELDRETGEWVDQVHGVNMTYRAVLGSVEDFAPSLWALAVERQVPQAADVAVVADGADWIWNLADDLFPDSVQIVDWYHATEYLAHAAEALYPNDSDAAHTWQQARRDDLFLGETHKLIEPLQRAGLTTQADYFRQHSRRMQYQEFHEQDYPIGSGTVESGIKRFKHRLSGPGMRWSRPAAERMLVLRAAVLSGTFDELWQLAKN